MPTKKRSKTPTQLFMDNVEKLVNFYITIGKSEQKTFEYASSILPNFDMTKDQFELLLKTALVAWLASEKNQQEEMKVLKNDCRALSLELDIVKKALDKEVVSKEESPIEISNPVEDFEFVKKHAERLSLTLNRLTAMLLKSKKLPPELKETVKEYSSGFELTKGWMGSGGPQNTFHIAGWNIQLSSDGFYRAFRAVKRKNIGVHLGRTIVLEKALKKIRAKEAELKLKPVKMTKSDLAYKI